MKRFKNLLDYLVSLAAAWKVILPIIAILVTASVFIGKNSLKIVDFSLPVWVIFILVVMAFYPIVKIAENLIKRKQRRAVRYLNLLWKPALFNFQYPKPFCPYDGCELEVICKEIPPQSFQVVTSVTEAKNTRFEYQYTYECPIHGQLSNVPNEEIGLLQHKAKIVMKK